MTTERTRRGEAGRTAGKGELAQKLPGADAAYLAGALDNPALTEEHVVTIAKNPAADQRILSRIGEERAWTRSYAVKHALVRHPKTPHAVAMNFVKFLYWKDLHLVGNDHFVHPPLRILAEKTLIDRLPQLALGEKMTLGRIAGRALIPKLLADKNPKVVEAVLWNGRLTAQEILSAIGDSRTPADVLAEIARHPKWISRAEVRAALAHNPRTPLPVALGLLTGMTDRDLSGIAEDPHTPRAVKMACRRVLAENSKRRGLRGR